MLILVCGEDIVKSREYYLQSIESYKKQGYVIQHIGISELQNVLSEQAGSLSLFGQQSIYTIDNLNRKIGRSKDMLSVISDVSKNSTVVLVVWEEGLSQRDLKIAKFAAVKEFKPSSNIFHLLEACYPSNIKKFSALLNQLSSPQYEMFIYIMLIRHIRKLLLSSFDVFPQSIQPWQKTRLISQTKKWEKDLLISFYERLLNLEVLLKSGMNPFSLVQSIDILSCYYLK